MTERCENCNKDVIPVKKEDLCMDETIIDYKCPECNHTLRSVTIKK